ncbi:MAG: lysophospholipid acyltransferase family protein, partial [Gammaproteobacteria bacterium]|nr:lysophospholipid acyltransferase family protein [Gammaproteobacteria bacterium]
IQLGTALGGLLYHLIPKRRAIASTNIRICFPNLGAEKHQQLLKEHFHSLGISLFEMGMAWWRSPEWLQKRCKIKGLEHIHAAEKNGRGVIILIAHFTTVEIAIRLGALNVASHVTFAEPKNPLFNAVMQNRRNRYFKTMITHRDVRQMIRKLKQGEKLWYAPDQSSKQSRGGIVVNYFGHPVITTPATARLARLSGAAIVPILPRRLPNGAGYEFEFQAPLTDFPSKDLEADTQRINHLFETQIKQVPEQYLWVHKRFKSEQAGQKDPYA